MDCSTPRLPVHHQLQEFTQTRVHWVGNAIQPSHPLSSSSPPAFNLSQHQGLFKWVSSSHEVAKVLDSVTQSCPNLCDPMDCSTPELSTLHYLPDFVQTHLYWVGDAIKPSHSLSPPSTPALNLSQNQGLFQWVSSLHEVAKVLEFQLQHHSFQRTPRTDLL